MPDDVKHEDPVQAYRNYYNVHKQHIATWKFRDMPDWFIPDFSKVKYEI
jgi:hypothetical protein